MKRITVTNKQDYLNRHYPFYPVPRLSDRRRCAQCGQDFLVQDYTVFKDDTREEFICCPNAPDCPGIALDWMRIA